MPRAWSAWLCGLAAAVACATSVVLPGVAGAAAADDVLLVFDGPRGWVTAVANAGTADTRQRVVSRNGGRLRRVASTPGSGNAARFPAYDGASSGRRAVVAVTNPTPTDRLSPAARAFAFGAKVKLDAAASTSTYDNGNNILQRGLYFASAQYKLQIDGARASCRVKGDAAARTIESTATIKPGFWYVVTCAKVPGPTGADLTLRVTRLNADGTRRPTVTTTTRAALGPLTFVAATPLSIGGKLNPNGTVATESDQFNGVIDNAFLRIS